MSSTASTARKLEAAEARIAELEAVLSGCNEWFTRYHPTANIRKPGGKPTPALITIRDAIARADGQVCRAEEAEAKIDTLHAEVVKAQNRRDEALKMLRNLLRAAMCMQAKGWRENPIAEKCNATIVAAHKMLHPAPEAGLQELPDNLL